MPLARRPGYQPDTAVIPLEQDYISPQEVSPLTLQFDKSMEALEDILVDHEFIYVQRSFLESNLDRLIKSMDDSGLVHELHKEYRETMLHFVQGRLGPSIMALDQMHQIAHEKQVDGDIFDFLNELLDAHAFSDHVSSFLRHKQGHFAELESSLVVKPHQ